MDTDPVKVIDVLSQERDDEHLARSRAEDERDHLRAEVERLRALVARQKLTFEEIANPLRFIVHEAKAEGTDIDGMVAVRLSEDANYLKRIARNILADPEGQRAAAESDALVAVAKEAETEPVMSDNLRAKLAHLRAVRDGDGTEEG